MDKTRTRRRYDHRLRRLVRDTGNIQLAIENGVPRSTARDWSRCPTADVISLDVLSMSEDALQQEVLALRQQNARLTAVLRLVVVLVKVSGVTLSRRRVADGARKDVLLRAVDRSREVLSLRCALRILGLSADPLPHLEARGELRPRRPLLLPTDLSPSVDEQRGRSREEDGDF